MVLRYLILASFLLHEAFCFTRLEPVTLGGFRPSQNLEFLPNEPALLDIVQAVDRGEALQNIFEVENLGENIAREIETVAFESSRSEKFEGDKGVPQSRGFLGVLDRKSTKRKKTLNEVPTDGGLQPVNFRPCPGGGPAPTSLHVNCTSRVRDTCSLSRGAPHALVVTFTPSHTSSHAVVSLLSWRTWLEMPILGQDTRACHYTPCPLVAGRPATLRYTLRVPAVVGQRRDTIIWRLFDKQTREKLLCFTFRTHIT